MSDSFTLEQINIFLKSLSGFSYSMTIKVKNIRLPEWDYDIQQSDETKYCCTSDVSYHLEYVTKKNIYNSIQMTD